MVYLLDEKHTHIKDPHNWTLTKQKIIRLFKLNKVSG